MEGRGPAPDAAGLKNNYTTIAGRVMSGAKVADERPTWLLVGSTPAAVWSLMRVEERIVSSIWWFWSRQCHRPVKTLDWLRSES